MSAGNVAITVRKMKTGELGQVAAILNQEIHKHASVGELLEWLKSIGSTGGDNIYAPWYLAVNRVGGEIIGFIRYGAHDFKFENRRVMIANSLLAVKKDYHGMGVGTKLVETSLSKICRRWRTRRIEPVMVIVEADEPNRVARRFYEKVLEKPGSFLMENVWGPDRGTVLYFKKLPSNR